MRPMVLDGLIADLLRVRCAVYNGTPGITFGRRFDRPTKTSLAKAP